MSKIPLVASFTNGVGGNISSFSAPQLTDISGMPLLNFSDNCTGNATSSSCVEGWADGSHYRISAGTSKTFEVHETILGTLGTGASVSFGLGSKSNFVWDDVAGNNIGNLNGTGIYSYPTNTVTTHN